MKALNHDEIAPDTNPTGEALLDRSRAPIKIWIPGTKALVLGHSQKIETEVNVAAVAADGIPLFRRMGGGGAVLLSPACVCVGLRFRKQASLGLHDYFAMGSGLIARAVKHATGLELVSRGISDLAFGNRKAVGCSLYMPRDFVLYLASILVAGDYADIEKYLAHPSREPDYRAGRSHREFLAGLAELTHPPLETGALVEALRVEAQVSLRGLMDEPRVT